MLDTIIIGLLILSALIYGFWQYYAEHDNVSEKRKNEAHKKLEEYATKDSKTANTKKQTETSGNQNKPNVGKSSKRSNLKKRSDKANYSHNWLLTTLKGHTGSVMDMSFSANGKYLATCADDPSPITQQPSSSSLDGESDVTNETSTSSDDSPKQKRTQRNRKANQHFAKQRSNRNQNGKLMSNHHGQANNATQPNLSIKSSSYEKCDQQQQQHRYRALEPPLRQHTKLNLTEVQLMHYLGNYLLDDMSMRLLGFPIEHDVAPSLAIIFKYPPYEFISQRKTAMSATTTTTTSSTYYSGSPIFVNQNDGLIPTEENFGCEVEINDSDSGQGSGSSSPSDDYEMSVKPIKVKPAKKPYNTMVSSQKECVRCGKDFIVTNNGDYLTNEPCLYHWGKINQFYDGQQMRRVYSCCNRNYDSNFINGCSANRVHVWTGVSTGLNGPYEGFVRTRRRREQLPADGVFALDCEMCFTGCGLELAKVTIIRSDGNLHYESFVRPERDIVDYNTRFSGITEKDLNINSSCGMRRASTASNSSASSTSSNSYHQRTVKSLQEVQKDLLKFIFEDTILIGHSIENDLKALKLIHRSIVDTSIVFPHYYGLPYRRSLKSLTKSILKRDIQTADNGHCSFEDSRACLELMLWKVRKDFREVLEQH